MKKTLSTLSLLIALVASAGATDLRTPSPATMVSAIQRLGNVPETLTFNAAAFPADTRPQKFSSAILMQALSGSPQDLADLQAYVASARRGQSAADALVAWHQAVQGSERAKKVLQQGSQILLKKAAIDPQRMGAIFDNSGVVTSQTAEVQVAQAPKAAAKAHLAKAQPSGTSSEIRLASVDEIRARAGEGLSRAAQTLAPKIEIAGQVASKLGKKAMDRFSQFMADQTAKTDKTPKAEPPPAKTASAAAPVKDQGLLAKAKRTIVKKTLSVGPVVVEEGAGFLVRRIQNTAETIKGVIRIAKAISDSKDEK